MGQSNYWCTIRKHTDQYLNFQSPHPLHHKLGVVRTLMDRMENVVTEEADKREEELRIRNALADCGYPKWALDRVKQQMSDKHQQPKTTKKTNETPSRGMVVIPYVEGVAEKLNRAFRKHNIFTAMRPTNTLKSILVHPKDKRDLNQISDAVYDIPCKTCDMSYIGETGHLFGTCLKEHQKDSEKISDIKFTRANRKASTSEQHKSAITDHIAQENHIIDWEGATILDRDSNSTTRKIREAIHIRKRGVNAINCDDGSMFLDHVYDPLQKSTLNPRRENNTKCRRKRSGPDHL